MKNIIAISIKELRVSLLSPMFYIIVSIFLILNGFLFSSSSMTYSETSIRGFLQACGLLLMLMIAVLSMRLFAEEKKLGTIELLLTAPIKDREIVLGKFFGSLGIVIIMIIFTFVYPALLKMYGDPDMGPIAAGYLGLFLVGCASLAVGIFSSSITSNQIVAAVITGGILFVFWFLGSAASYLPNAIGNVVVYFSFSRYFTDFVTGIIDTRAIVFYLSMTVLFLFLTTRSIENSRYN